jgi:hypothetical protein
MIQGGKFGVHVCQTILHLCISGLLASLWDNDTGSQLSAEVECKENAEDTLALPADDGFDLNSSESLWPRNPA